MFPLGSPLLASSLLSKSLVIRLLQLMHFPIIRFFSIQVRLHYVSACFFHTIREFFAPRFFTNFHVPPHSFSLCSVASPRSMQERGFSFFHQFRCRSILSPFSNRRSMGKTYCGATHICMHEGGDSSRVDSLIRPPPSCHVILLRRRMSETHAG